MTKTNIIVAAALAVSMVGTVQASLTTGNDLMQHCITAPDSFCAGYIGGGDRYESRNVLFPSRCNQKADNKHHYYVSARPPEEAGPVRSQLGNQGNASCVPV